MSKYEVKNVKSFTGREGYGYECSLYCDGKKVAKVLDEANGGECYFSWDDYKSEKVKVTYERYGTERTVKATPAEAAFYEHLKGKTYEFYGETNNHCQDTYVGHLVEVYEQNKQIKKWCKKETVFRLKGDKEGSFRTVKAPYDSRVQAFIDKKYGDKVEEVLNKRFA